MMPTSVLRTLFLGVFGWAVLGLGIYLIYEWVDDLRREPRTVAVELPGEGPADPQENRTVVRAEASDDVSGWPALAGGIALVLFSTVGPFPLLRRLSRRGPGDPDPNEQKGRPQTIERPDGSQIHVEVFGPATGPTLVCTHGWSLDRTDWMHLIDRFGERYRIVVWDLPGLGRSTAAANRDCSLEKYAGDLLAVVEATGEGRTIVIGHSIGGMIALVLCRLYPAALDSRIHGLVLVHTTYRNPLTTMLGAPLWTALQKPLIEPLNYLTIAIAPLAWLANWQSYLNGSLHLTSRITSFSGRQSGFQIDYSSRLAALAWPGILARGNLAMLRFDEESTLPTISVPTLVVGGKYDRITKVEASERIDAAAPRSDLVVLDPGGHLGLWESHDQFLPALERFVADIAEPSASPARTRPGEEVARAGGDPASTEAMYEDQALSQAKESTETI